MWSCGRDGRGSLLGVVAPVSIVVAAADSTTSPSRVWYVVWSRVMCRWEDGAWVLLWGWVHSFTFTDYGCGGRLSRGELGIRVRLFVFAVGLVWAVIYFEVAPGCAIF